MLGFQGHQKQIELVRRLFGHKVAQNTLSLYGIQFAGYIIPLITLPYLARVLRAQGFGLLLFSQSFALGASITIEYGFNLCATRKAAQSQGDRQGLAALAADVLGAKLMLLAGFTVIAAIAGFTVGNFRHHPNYLLWAILQALAMGLSPFWYFQGTERMVGAVLIELFARAAAAMSILLVVKNSGDGGKALACLALAAGAILIVQTGWMYHEIGFQRPRWEASSRALRVGWDMFLFRGAYNIYGSANAFILGLFAPSLQVGYYGGAERIAKVIQGLTLPFSQAFYPHISRLAAHDRPKAERLVRRTIPLAGAVGFALAAVLALGAPRAVALILGRGYEGSIGVLYVFALILPFNSLNNALIMHWMLPLGMERAVGTVMVGGILTNIISASVLAPRLAHLGMAWAILIAEAGQLTALVTILLRRSSVSRRRFRETEIPLIESP
jgi:PST family polysaccharide transporter